MKIGDLCYINIPGEYEVIAQITGIDENSKKVSVDDIYAINTPDNELEENYKEAIENIEVLGDVTLDYLRKTHPHFFF